jgi:hypothetical protein
MLKRVIREEVGFFRMLGGEAGVGSGGRLWHDWEGWSPRTSVQLPLGVMPRAERCSMWQRLCRFTYEGGGDENSGCR